METVEFGRRLVFWDELYSCKICRSRATFFAKEADDEEADVEVIGMFQVEWALKTKWSETRDTRHKSPSRICCWDWERNLRKMLSSDGCLLGRDGEGGDGEGGVNK